MASFGVRDIQIEKYLKLWRSIVKLINLAKTKPDYICKIHGILLVKLDTKLSYWSLIITQKNSFQIYKIPFKRGQNLQICKHSNYL